jgi:hypothetical protein
MRLRSVEQKENTDIPVNLALFEAEFAEEIAKRANPIPDAAKRGAVRSA